MQDPYLLSPISYKDNPELFKNLLAKLEAKLEEANDIWYREEMIKNLKF